MQAERGTPESKLCSNLVRTFQSEAAKQRGNGAGGSRTEFALVADGCKIHGNCNAMEEKIELDEQLSFT